MPAANGATQLCAPGKNLFSKLVLFFLPAFLCCCVISGAAGVSKTFHANGGGCHISPLVYNSVVMVSHAGKTAVPSPVAPGRIDAFQAKGRPYTGDNLSQGVTAPTTQASNVVFSNTSSAGSTISWTIGNGLSEIVFIARGYHDGISLENNTNYTANTAYGSGSADGAGNWYCVYNGASTPNPSVNVTGLMAGTTYSAIVIDYNGSAGNEKYLMSTTGNLNTVTTSAPSATVASITPATTSTTTSATTLDYTVTFGGALTTGPSTGDFALTTTGTATGTINSVSTTDNINFDVNVTGVSGDGTLELDMPGTLNDVVPSLSNVPFTSGAAGTYTIDNPPTATGITFTSNDGNGAGIAAPGDQVTLSFAVNEPVQTPVVNIGTGSATVTTSDNVNYTATYTLQTSDQPDASGNVPYTIGLTDLSGNTVSYTELTPGNPNISFYTAPTIQAGNVTFTNVTPTSATINWTPGNGNFEMVMMAPVGTAPVLPVNNTGYGYYAGYGGYPLGAWSVVYNNPSASSAPVTGLTPGTAYTVMVIDYNVNAQGYTIFQYLTSPGTGNPATLTTTPSNDTSLQNLALGDGNFNTSLDQTAMNNTYSYSYDGMGLMLTATPNNSNATVAYSMNGQAVTFPITPDAGTYDFVVTVTAADGVTTQNYNVGVTVNPANPAFNAYIPSSDVYGTPSDAVGVSTTGQGQIQLTYSSSNTSVATIDQFGNITPLSVGSTTITITQVASTDYNSATASGTYSVTPASLTILPDNQAITYGMPIPALTATYTGFVNNDSFSNLGSNFTITTTGTSTSAPGNYPITASGAVDPNYTITYQNGTLTVMASTDATLSSLSSSSTTLTSSGTNTYTASVPYGVTSINVTATTNNAQATFTINGQGGITSGTAYTVNGLVAGNNTINVVVTAQDGKTTSTYTITVNEAAAPAITAGVVSGTITACAGTASVSPNVQQFTISGSNLTDNITIASPTGFELSTDDVNFSGSLTLTQANGSVGSTTIYARSAASDAPGAISGNAVANSSGASSQNVALGGTVNALPTITAPTNQTAGNGQATTAVTFAGTASSYTWTNDTPGIGLASSGSGNIASFTAANTGTTPVTATITATPVNVSSYAYIANSLSNNVSVINTVTNTVIATIPVGSSPYGVAASPDGSKVYVSNSGSNNVSVISTATNALTGMIPVGTSPGSLVVTPDGSKVYVVNTGSSSISVISTATATVTATITAQIGAQGIIVSPDGMWLYVSNSGPMVGVISTTQNRQVTSINLPLPQTLNMAISPDGTKLYVGNKSGTNSVYVVNTQNLLYNQYPLPGTPYGGLALSADGTKLYIGTEGYGIFVFNTTTNVLSAIIPSPAEAFGLSLTADGSKLFATTGFSNTVVVISTASNSVTKTINVGTNPNSYGNFISTIPGCSGVPATFTITVNPGAAVATSGALAALSTTPGTVSASTSFYVSGTWLQSSITITPPTGFEVSTNGQTYGKTATLTGSQGTLASTQVYVRLAAADASGAYSGNIALTSTNATTVDVPTVSSTVLSPEIITFNSLSPVTYGASDFAPGATSNNSNEAITYSSGNSNVATIVNGNIHIIGAGTANITASQVGDANYTAAANVTQQLTVKQAPLTVTAGSPTMIYGGTFPALTASYSGFVNNDGPTVVAPPALSTPGTSTSAAGSYPVTASGASAVNYNITYAAGTLTIGQAPLTITANSQSINYGMPIAPLTVSYSGFVNNDTYTSLTTAPAVTTNGTSTSTPGTYPITASGAIDANYSISYVAGTLTVVASTDATLSSVTSSAGTLTSGGSNSYTASVGNGVTSITVTPTTNNAQATLTVNGSAATSGSPVTISNLTVGANVVSIVVTAQSGATATYTLTVTRASAPPSVNYAGSPTYIQNTAITPLTPTSSNVAAPGYNSSPVILGSGFSGPTGAAVDAQGNIYVADRGNKQVKKIPEGNGPPVAISSGFNQPYGVAVDAAGDVYVADFGASAVYKIAAGSNTRVTIGSGFKTPTGVAVDARGDLYIADYGNNAVKEIAAGSTTIETIGSGFSGPAGIAVDAQGNVYVGDRLNNAVKEIPAGSNTPQIIGSGFNNPFGVAVDASGNVYIGDFSNNEVKEIPAGSNASQVIGSGFSDPDGIAVDGAGNVYVADYGNNAIKQIIPTGGFYITPFMPAGLSFSNTTGTIGGTPTATSPAAIYTVTVYGNSLSASATVNITVIALPTVGYTGPENYTAGVAITPLTPTSTNVAAVAYSSTPVIQGSGFSGPTGVAIDASGNIYVADRGNKLVKKIPAGNGTPVTVSSGFSQPYGVAVDAAGDVYVADYGASAVYKVPAGSSTRQTIGSGFKTPTGVAVDGAGDVYVADYGNNAVKKIAAGSNTPVAIGTGFSEPAGIAVDAQGNVYVGDRLNNAVKEIPAGSNTPQVIGSGFKNPFGVAVDGAGDVYVGDFGNNAVKIIRAGSNTPQVTGAGFSSPDGVAVDGAGNVYIADYGNNAIKQIKPVGGFYIAPFLPAGLTFNSTTGVISGTPVAPSPATNYTVTVYNTNATSTGALAITVINSTPTVSYTSPHIYTLNTAITPLVPASSGIAGPAYNSTPVALGSGFSGPTGVAVDLSGNVYVADRGNKFVKKIPAGNGTPTTISSGFNQPYGVAVDAAGDVYVADFGASAIYKIAAGSSTRQTIGSGFKTPTGVAVDAAGDVFVADYGNNAVKEIAAGSNTPQAIGSGFDEPAGIAVDGKGNVFVGDRGNNAGKEIPAGSNTPVVIGSGFNNPFGVAVDASGNVYVGDYSNNQVKMIPAGSNTPVVIGSGFSNPDGVAADGAGNIYVADNANNAVKQIQPVGGFYIKPFLPAGLSFNNTTGIISGTPTAASPPTNYTVTAYNNLGSSSATVNIAVLSNNANLANLVLSSGPLSPVFATGTPGYTANVPNTVSSVTVTPVTSDPTATVTVNGTAVTSGTASPGQPLAPGPNTITTVVTAQNGVTTQTYTITVTQAGPGAAFRPVNYTSLADSASTGNDDILVHEGLSPNGDGINDFLVIDGITQYPENHLMIINRNGALIYQAKGYDNSKGVFDGHSNINGKMQAPGTYFYSLDYIANGITKHKTGYIVLKY